MLGKVSNDLRFYDICNQHELISGCVTGKISQVLTSLIFMGESQ
jgi:hypothetical protein